MPKQKKPRPTNLSLSQEALDRLRAAAKHYGVTMTAIAEDLILNSETGLTDFTDSKE
jgi:hypothetical protein